MTSPVVDPARLEELERLCDAASEYPEESISHGCRADSALPDLIAAVRARDAEIERLRALLGEAAEFCPGVSDVPFTTGPLFNLRDRIYDVLAGRPDLGPAKEAP